MAAVKITPADKWFSKCVRISTGWICERCNSYSPEDKRMGLHCAHTVRRGNWSTRFDPNNCLALCNGCHRMYDHDYDFMRNLFCKLRGEGLWDRIQEKKSDTRIGRQLRKEKKEIAQHYKREYERMDQMRMDGVIGRIEFEAYL